MSRCHYLPSSTRPTPGTGNSHRTLRSISQLAEGWLERFGVDLRTADQPSAMELLVVDAQRDFCLPEGALFVGGRSGAGAVDDSVRLARFVYRNLASISGITMTMDSHYPYQIFFPSFWLDQGGQHLADYTVVTSEMVESGRARPDPALARWLSNGDYELADAADRALLSRAGTEGQVPAHVCGRFTALLERTATLSPASFLRRCLFHSLATRTQMSIEEKGGHPLTENYSAISPEITRHRGREADRVTKRPNDGQAAGR